MTLLDRYPLLALLLATPLAIALGGLLLWMVENYNRYY